ncbi:hypothetical protein yruck0001_14480 [Yersinia ruckeri ATCC 29473]|nr:hypothetical protein yruck0001_14480 [Yersinia ruckeri ATCC 29473]
MPKHLVFPSNWQFFSSKKQAPYFLLTGLLLLFWCTKIFFY